MPTAIQPVLNAVAKTAARLCEANELLIFRVEGTSSGRWPSVNDVILAASAPTTGGKILTQNVKHYPMPDIERGW